MRKRFYAVLKQDVLGHHIETVPDGHMLALKLAGADEKWQTRWQARPNEPPPAIEKFAGFDRKRFDEAIAAANECDPVDDGECLVDLLCNHLQLVSDQEAVVRWTTAPADYDINGVVVLETGITCRGKTWRKVSIHPDQYRYYDDRLGSGMHPLLERDPRDVEREIAESLANEKAARDLRESEEAAAAKWMAETSLADLLAARERYETDETALPKRINHTALRQHIDKLYAEKKNAEQREAYERMKARVPEQCITRFKDPDAGWEKAHEAWYLIQVEPFLNGRDADSVHVAHIDQHGRFEHTSLGTFDLWIERGLIEPRTADQLPPRPVYSRIGGDPDKIYKCDINHRTVGQVLVEATTVWVGWPLYAREPMVLDKDGHLVRKKIVVDEARQQYYVNRDKKESTTV